MKKTLRFWILFTAILAAAPLTANAYKINGDIFSPVGGTFSVSGSSPDVITACNMQPFGTPTAEDFAELFEKAEGLASEGRVFKNSLGFYDCTQSTPGGTANCTDNRLKTLLTDPNANYETTGFIQAFQDNGIESKMKEAIKTFAYLVAHGYSADASLSLKQSLRDLVTIYMVFADEFLIDALDYRFSGTTFNMDAYLDEQIVLLGKSIDYYQIGSKTFVDIWVEPIVSSNQIIGQLFTQEEWDLFSLLYQRLTMAVRENGSRERVRLIKPTDDILTNLVAEISSLYIQSAAMSQTLGNDFTTFGGDKILSAMNMLKKQLANLKAGRNPLGYDERYVPLSSFRELYSLANGLQAQCSSLESAVQQEKREYDYVSDKVIEEQNALNTSYMTQLSEITGCNATDPYIFAVCVKSAGFDLYDCAIESSPEIFEDCVKSKTSSNSVLGAKYRQIKDADLSLQLARLRFEDIGKQIENENAQTNYLIEIWKDYTGAQKEALSEYQKKLINSCLITEVKEEVKINGQKLPKTKQTTKTFTLRDDSLAILLDKEKALYDATYDFNVKLAKDDTVIKNLLLQQAEALIGIDLAVNNKNIMIAASDAAMSQKDNLLAFWQRNLEFFDKYWNQKLPTQRIILSDKILKLTAIFNELSHYSHLATKALEYKYMKVLQGIILPGGDLNASDLFKCQTTLDYWSYLAKLDSYDVLGCPAGTFQTHDYRVSVVYDILGLTNKYLGDLNNDGIIDSNGKSVLTVQYELFQQFVNQHLDENGNLTFVFSSSVYDKVFQSYQKANLKIWQGPVPGGTTTTPRGLAVSLFFNSGSGTLFPVLYLAQKGSQTFLRADHELAEYYPVKVLALVNKNNQEPEPFTKDYFTPFKNIDPRFDTAPMGEWTSTFSNRSVSATDWKVTLYREPAEYGFDSIPFSKLYDIRFYLGTIGANFE